MANTNMISSNHNSNSNSTAAYTYNNYNSASADSGNSSGSNGGGISGSGSIGLGVGGVGSEVQTLREVCNMLNSSATPSYMIPTGGCAYDHIIAMMRGLNLQDDGIVLNNKIKAIETDFCNIVRDESMLCESMDYMNNKALTDAETALKFALLFSSRNFDALAMKETKVRSAMLKILETNFMNAAAYRLHDKNRLYNSITLLGEYYHRVRLADNAPITILGDSLLNLLLHEIKDISVVMSTRLARLVLSQITLNGEIMRTRHKTDIDQLLYHVRRHLIMQPALTAKVKAMLLMVLDLFYSHFKHVGEELEAMYTNYLIVDDDEDDGVNNNNNNNSNSGADTQTQTDAYSDSEEQGSSANNSAQEVPKKWSEQVCEDSLCDIVYGETGSNIGDEQQQQHHQYSENAGNAYQGHDTFTPGRQARRGYQPRHVPRPLKQAHTQTSPAADNISSDHYPSMGSSEDRDETKPLPSWRKTRFNRANDGDHSNGRSRQDQQRRYSISCDDDHQSVRSEGRGNLRLYSIDDRRKHSQERYERNLGGSSNYNNIVNSNWDQRDDRSERSYISNYERGNSYKRGGRHNNHNRNTYDKPPRFQKQHQQMQQQHHDQHQQHHQQHRDQQKIHSETWRRSNTAINNAYQDENCAYNSNGPESNSRSSSRARTLPRPAKSQMDDGTRKSNSNAYRYSQSPTRPGGSGSGGVGIVGGPRNFQRYSSQSSLASEASSTFDRRQRAPDQRAHSHQHQPQRHRNFTRRSQPNIHQPQEQQQGPSSQEQQQHPHPNADNTWHEAVDKDESELVRNAQQTTKYMNYLSAQK
ncbi:GATA zinc finger domain-containing protein 14 [Drosophila grimshawi]|uniref:GH21616 n=1 Tax=Drosophila grimshawi TaxID=7222 RepID=B4J5A8_DROGR|nr:GATA zinc finger domain-containing protein 14 [Drosophila grimshawi]EDW01750.1 GH21616 [Drosophila grimshawi]